MPKKPEHQMDRITGKLTDSILQSIDHFPESQVPFASVELSKDEQIAEYMKVRDDPGAWYDLLMEKGLKAVVDYATTMEKMLKTSDAEVQDGNTENE